jgi:hypothetical protein
MRTFSKRPVYFFAVSIEVFFNNLQPIGVGVVVVAVLIFLGWY